MHNGTDLDQESVEENSRESRPVWQTCVDLLIAFAAGMALIFAVIAMLLYWLPD
jgi:hypothetical protein